MPGGRSQFGDLAGLSPHHITTGDEPFKARSYPALSGAVECPMDPVDRAGADTPVRRCGSQSHLQLDAEAVLETAVTATLVLQVVEAVDELDGVHGGVPLSVLQAVERGVA